MVLTILITSITRFQPLKHAFNYFCRCLEGVKSVFKVSFLKNGIKQRGKQKVFKACLSLEETHTSGCRSVKNPIRSCSFARVGIVGALS